LVKLTYGNKLIGYHIIPQSLFSGRDMVRKVGNFISDYFLDVTKSSSSSEFYFSKIAVNSVGQ